MIKIIITISLQKYKKKCKNNYKMEKIIQLQFEGGISMSGFDDFYKKCEILCYRAFTHDLYVRVIELQIAHFTPIA